MSPGPGAERGRRERGQLPALIQAGRQPRAAGNQGYRQRGIRGAGRERREPGPARQLAERVVGSRAQAAPVSLVQDLRLVGGHVHPGRALC